MSDGSSTILLIENNDDLQEALSELLVAVGYGVVTASGVKEAEQIYAARSAEIDLLVVDAFLPKTRGVEVVNRLRALGGPVPALLLSAYDETPELRHEADQWEFVVLQMPFSAEALTVKVREALAVLR